MLKFLRKKMKVIIFSMAILMCLVTIGYNANMVMANQDNSVSARGIDPYLDSRNTNNGDVVFYSKVYVASFGSTLYIDSVVSKSALSARTGWYLTSATYTVSGAKYTLAYVIQSGGSAMYGTEVHNYS